MLLTQNAVHDLVSMHMHFFIVCLVTKLLSAHGGTARTPVHDQRGLTDSASSQSINVVAHVHYSLSPRPLRLFYAFRFTVFNLSFVYPCLRFALPVLSSLPDRITFACFWIMSLD